MVGISHRTTADPRPDRALSRAKNATTDTDVEVKGYLLAL